jgi:hypothetical protein
MLWLLAQREHTVGDQVDGGLVAGDEQQGGGADKKDGAANGPCVKKSRRLTPP